jgi:Cys-tRNA(Pro)/Cys-tRNA(Cys) deacylase
MTPAVNALKQAKVAFRLHEYHHDPATTAFGEEVVAALGVSPAVVFKTLVVALNGDARQLAVAILPVAAQLDLKLMARAASVKRSELADPQLAERTTGYVVGGISPLGQRKRLRTFLDQSAAALPALYLSAGKRGLQLELAPADLIRLTQATLAPLAEQS